MEKQAIAGSADEVIGSLLETTPLSHERSDDDVLRALEATVPGLAVASFETDPHVFSDGILDSYSYYFTCREGVAQLWVGEKPLEAPLYCAFGRYEETSGARDERFWLSVMKNLIPQLKKAPFRYTFKGKQVGLVEKDQRTYLVPTGEEELFQVWGNTASEAFRKIAEPSSHLADLGFSTSLQLELFNLQSVSPIPLQTDYRVFPSTDPAFQVLD